MTKKAIWVDKETHAEIKIQAIRTEMTTGEYIASLVHQKSNYPPAGTCVDKYGNCEDDKCECHQ